MAPRINERLALHDKFLRILQEAAKERPKREGFVPAPGGGRLGFTEPGWVDYERQRMFEAVNWERHLRGIPQVTPQQIIRVETQACGHTDYASKYALYCAELALGEDRPEP